MQLRKFIAYASLYVVVCASGLSGLDGPFAPTDCDKLSLQKAPEIKPGRNIITSVTDSNGSEYLIKQLEGDPSRYITKTAIEALGAFIAESAGILTNHISILPADEPCESKFFPGQPATIHTFVPGPQLVEHALFSKIDIRQKKINESPFVGPGITALTIRSMTVHQDMPRIAALDTFIGNPDRHASNLIYDKYGDHFYAIDFSLAFSINLAEHSLRTIRKLKKSNRFSVKEKRALRTFRNMLKKLLGLHSPKSLCAQFDELIDQTGFVGVMSSFSPQESEAVYEKIRVYKKYIIENYLSSKHLVAFLDTLLKDGKKTVL